MRVERSDDEVVLHVTHPGVSLVPRMIDHGLSVGAIDERIVVRHEGAGP